MTMFCLCFQLPTWCSISRDRLKLPGLKKSHRHKAVDVGIMGQVSAQGCGWHGDICWETQCLLRLQHITETHPPCLSQKGLIFPTMQLVNFRLIWHRYPRIHLYFCFSVICDFHPPSQNGFAPVGGEAELNKHTCTEKQKLGSYSEALLLTSSNFLAARPAISPFLGASDPGRI